jgi:hypothetical protein
MRVVTAATLALLPALSGCNIAHYASHNLINDPILESHRIKLRHRLRADARDAWKQECQSTPGADFSAAYRDGFLDGFVDNLDNGGPPQPPVAPPTRYRRKVDDFTPAGQQAERDYLAGFQRGAEVAFHSGCRQALLVEMALPGPKPESPLSITCIPAGASQPGADTPSPAPAPADPPATPADPPPGPRVTPPPAVRPPFKTRPASPTGPRP